ncbi:MAG: hypothetical protein VX951_06520 [Planctomycetota bacterium]|nr:hypothetical protein [Planctomycetota bacterium]
MRAGLLLTVGLIASTVVAQSRSFEIHPGSTNASSRGGLGTVSGETLMGLHSSHWRGLGDTGIQCEVTQLGLVDQDQNSSTQESFHLVIRSGSDANGPGTGAVDLIARYGPFSMPSTPVGSINAWIQTVTLSTPAVIPCEAHFAWGVELTNSPNWASDGMSCHTSFNRTGSNGQFCHPNAETHGYYFTTGSAQATGEVRTWRHRLGLSSARNILQLGASGVSLGGGTRQRYGLGGMFPATGETLTGRVTQCIAGDTVWSYLGATYIGGGLSVSPATRLWLNPSPFMVLVGSSTATGGSETHFYGPMPSVSSAIGPLPFQAAVIRGGAALLTNSNAVTIL